MKKFLQRTLLYSLIVIGINIPLGRFLASYETVELKAAGQFFPASRWDDYYALEDKIDILVLGSSHAYRSYDPEIISGKLGHKTVFNFGSSGQTPRTGYFILEEVLRNHQPELIVMDVFVMVFAEDKEANTARINWSVMQPGAGKRRFFKASLSWSQKIKTTLFPTYLYRAYFKKKIQAVMGLQHTIKKNNSYEGNGFVSSPDTLSYEGLIEANKKQSPSEDLSFIDENSLFYLEKIKERCAAKGIPLVFVVSPIPELTAERIGVYDESTEFFTTLAQQWGIPYYDYIDQRLESIKDGAHYYDHHHMNAAGASLFSEEVADILKKHLP